jgi:hypothetical protein
MNNIQAGTVITRSLLFQLTAAKESAHKTGTRKIGIDGLFILSFADNRSTHTTIDKSIIQDGLFPGPGGFVRCSGQTPCARW